MKSSILTLIFIWLAWVVSFIGFQSSEFYLSIATVGLTSFSLEHITSSMPQYFSPQPLQRVSEALARI